MTEIYGTLGPACSDEKTLLSMFRNGMTGVRLNLSHTTLKEASETLTTLKAAARLSGKNDRLLIDMQGPELRIGKLPDPIVIAEGADVLFGKDGIPVPEIVIQYVSSNSRISLDDGKIALTVSDVSLSEKCFHAVAYRGGILSSRKSVAVENTEIEEVPALTAEDMENISCAAQYGVYAVMQPFVRSGKDLQELRSALDSTGCSDVRIFAKIENRRGVENLEEIMAYSDEIVIARGDLGNAMPLWELPKMQKIIAQKCREAGKPFMVVTQMLASMENAPVPTRAEVSDIFNAVCDGASSVMVTGETAAGKYPAEAIRYLAKTVEEAENYLKE